MDVNLNEAEKALSPEEFKGLADNPTQENMDKYPNVYSLFKEKGLIKEADSVVADEDPVFSMIKTRYGEGYGSVEEFFNKVDTVLETEGQNPFQDLPIPLKEAIALSKQGKDYRQAINPEKLVDYTKNYTDRELLDLYMPNTYAIDDFNDDTKKDLIAKSISLVRANHRLAVSAEQGRISQLQEKSTREIAYYNQTIDKSIAYVKKQYPNLRPEQVSRLTKELQTATFQNLFFDGKGGINEKAANNLMPLIFGDDFINKIGKPLAEQHNKDMEEVLNRGGDVRQGNKKAVVYKQTEPVIPEVFKQKTSPYAIRSTK